MPIPGRTIATRAAAIHRHPLALIAYFKSDLAFGPFNANRSRGTSRMAVNVRERLLHDSENPHFQIPRQPAHFFRKLQFHGDLATFEKPSTYQRSVESSPASSSSGGCNKYDIVRNSCVVERTSATLSAMALAASGLTLEASIFTIAKFIPKAARDCPELSCNSREMWRLSSSCNWSNRVESTRRFSSASFNSAVRSFTFASSSSCASSKAASRCWICANISLKAPISTPISSFFAVGFARCE